MTDREGSKSILIQVIHDGMGAADPALQHTLLRKYLLLSQENGTLPGAICFYTSGVKMVVEGSPVLDILQALEARGVRLIVCKTCLDYFGLLEKVRVGIVGGMGDIIAAQWLADKVISLQAPRGADAARREAPTPAEGTPFFTYLPLTPTSPWANLYPSAILVFLRVARI